MPRSILAGPRGAQSRGSGRPYCRLVELELWPNLIRAAKRSGAKVAIVNARLSPRSFRGYRSLRGALQTTFRHIDAVAAQNAEYAQRFIELGVPSQRVRVTGSVKYDGLECDRNNAKTRELRTLLGLSPSDLVFVAGSTMEGEEAAVLAAYTAARRQHPGLRLILVPRHAERFDSVARWLEKQGEDVQRRSLLTTPARIGDRQEHRPSFSSTRSGSSLPSGGWRTRHSWAAVLIPGRGGQNMIEPAAYGAAVMLGPHTTNFRDTVDQLLERDAVRQVADAGELTQCLLDDLDDPETAAARGAAGQKLRTFPEWRRRPHLERARSAGGIIAGQSELMTTGLRFWLGFAEIGSAPEIRERCCLLRPARGAWVLRGDAPIDINMGE